MFLAGQDREEQTQIRREAEAKIVEQQRKNNIKPYFKWIGNSSRPDGRVGIDLKNNGGGEARNIEILMISGNTTYLSITKKATPANDDISIYLRSTITNAYSSTATLRINFEDIDGTKYYQQIDKSSNNHISVSDPVEIIL